jgi:tetratricopeptide (TPR) repeat protein
MAFREGDRFGRYIIGPLLGQGGMGEVRRAEDTILVRSVALKILLHDEAWGAGVSPSPDAIARLMREARAAAALDHPNAVAIFDVGEEGDRPYIAMELIDGITLRALIGDEEQPLDRRIRWSLEVARALAAAHRRGIVHRDVKPENVMVRADGVVKVLDFGIARSAQLAEGAAATSTRAPGAPILPTLTEKGLSVGTPLYMAPEQLRGEPVDPRCDQFAWGVVVYELLTGASPWASDAGPLQAVSNILTRKPPPMRTANAAVPAEVDDLVRRALSKEAADRFATMDDVVRSLEPHAGVAPERRAATMPPQRVKRRRTRVITLSLVVAALVAAAGAFRMRETQRARASADNAAKASAADASVTATTTERGSKLSANAEATAAYRAGMQALHDASLQAAREQFRHAVALDPTFAAAYLGMVLAVWDVDDELRDGFRRAESGRASLSERDVALLTALEPWMRVPRDLNELTARLAALTQRSPDDAEAWVQLGKARTIALDYDGAIAGLDAALHVDPEWPEALDVRATAYAFRDRADDAMRDYDECIRIAPGATSCLRSVSQIQVNEGKCAEAEQSARSIIKAEPGSSYGYGLLAKALFGEGHPIESVKLALEAQVERARLKADTKASARFRVAEAEGQLDEALLALGEWDTSLRDNQDDGQHFYVMQRRAELFFEVGRPRDAAGVARDYLKRRAGWTPDPSELEPTLLADVIRYRAGDLSREAFVRERDAWRDAEWARLELQSRPAGRAYLWFGAYAASVKSAVDAREAVSALDAFRPIPAAFERDVEMDEALGATLLTAGRAEEALAPLRRAAASCRAIEKPVIHTRAMGELGEALKKTGDRVGACDAYRRVVVRWGKAKPRSVTAERARAGAHALRCAAD